MNEISNEHKVFANYQNYFFFKKYFVEKFIFIMCKTCKRYFLKNIFRQK